MDPYGWSWNPEAIAVVLLGGAYLLAIRTNRPSPWRIACFTAALGLLVVVTVTPVHMLAMEYLLTIHLLQNVVLAEWAPLLVALGIPPLLATTLTRTKLVRRLTHPAVALPVWLANYMLWHLPWLYDTALEHPNSLLHLEHALYFVTGAAFWWSVVQDAPHRLRPGTRAAVVFGAFVLASPIGLVLALIPNVIYDFYADAPERLWGLSALEDQQLAGLLMALEQAVVFFAVFAYWFVRFFAEEERREEIDRAPEAA